MSSSGARSRLLLLTALTLFTPLPSSAAPPPTTHAFERLEGGGDRIFFSERERRVPLRIRNEGFIAWEPDAGFTISYLWLSPSEKLVGEGFRTRLRTRVEPGESVEVTARVKDLPPPGIYRLRWDVVHEGVTWFSEKDRTPEPARWVVVLPTVEFFLVLVLPTIAAIGGLLLCRFAPPDRWPLLTATAASADLIWLAISLYGKQFLLFSELPRRFLPGADLSTASAVALPLFAVVLFPRRWRPWAAWATATAAALLVWGQTLYLRFFGDVATSAAVLASRQTGEIRESIGFLAAAADSWLLVDLLIALPLVIVVRKMKVERTRRVLIGIVLLALAAPLLGGLRDVADYSRGRNLRTLRDVRDFGLYGYQALDLAGLAYDSFASKPPSEQEIEQMLRVFRNSAPGRAPAGPAAGIALGSNLLAIQIESMQQFVLDFEVGGEPVTPNLLRLAEEGLVFTAMQDQTSRGRSSAGDYVVNTSILPVAESVAYQYARNEHRGFAHVLQDRGYSTLSAIPYKRHFWNRYKTHPAYGFGTSLFVEDFASGARVGWGLNDVDFLRQMTSRLAELPEPFAAWLTTLSVHHPYKSFPDELKALDLGDLEGTALGNYLHGMNLLDRAIGELFEALELSGLRARTTIALWGDHSSGLLREDLWVEYFGLEGSGAERFMFRRVPFIVWVPNAPELRGRIDEPAGQIDIAPTLLALLGARPEREPFLGRNLLGDSRQALVVHPQGSWTSRELIYLNPRDEERGAVRCLSTRTLRPRRGEACRELNRTALEQIRLSELILRYDLQSALGSRLTDAVN